MPVFDLGARHNLESGSGEERNLEACSQDQPAPPRSKFWHIQPTGTFARKQAASTSAEGHHYFFDMVVALSADYAQPANGFRPRSARWRRTARPLRRLSRQKSR